MSSPVSGVRMRNIWQARKRIAPYVRKTPLTQSVNLTHLTRSPVYLKLENMHEIGAFKVRGAANKMLSLTAEERERGVTTFSTGNHALAVSYMAKQLGIKAVICISHRVPKVKVDAIKRLGADVKAHFNSQDEAETFCEQLERNEGLTVIKPFDDPFVIAGQGTIGLELLEDLPDVDTVVIPLSGGGLAAGVGLALKSMDANTRVIGVTMDGSAVMHESLKAGKPVVLEEADTLADSLLGGIGLNNRYSFKMVQRFIDETVLVTERSIAEGMTYMLNDHRMAVEGAAAVGIAALLSGRIEQVGNRTAVIITGNNVDLSVLLDVAQSCTLANR